MSEQPEQQPDLSPHERRRLALQDQVARAHRRLEELRREDFSSDLEFRDAQKPRQRHVWLIEEELSRLDQ